jgi:hypothetical protein
MESATDTTTPPGTITLTLAELRALITEIVDERLADLAEDQLELRPEFVAEMQRRLAEPMDTLPADEVFRRLGLE